MEDWRIAMEDYLLPSSRLPKERSRQNLPVWYGIDLSMKTYRMAELSAPSKIAKYLSTIKPKTQTAVVPASWAPQPFGFWV